MAQHPFAAQARQAMEESGIVFNADGSTSMKSETSATETEQQTQTPPANVEHTETNAQQITVDERDKLLAMQREELEQLRAEKASWQANAQTQVAKSEREESLERELEDLRSQIKNQTQQEQADAFRTMLEQQGFDSENLDDDVLLEIRDRFVKPMANKVEALEKRLSQQESKFREPTEAERLENVKRTTQQGIVAEIPDFMTIYNSKAFQDKLASKDPRFPTQTYGHALQLAYEGGDKDFIVREVKAFMSGGAPNLNDVADVGATNGVGNKAVDTNDAGAKYTFTDEEAVQMLRKRQIGDISRAEYSEYRAKLDASRSKS